MSIKKIFFCPVVIFAVYFLLFLSCASSKRTPYTNTTETPSKKPIFDVNYKYESKNPAISIDVTPKWINKYGITEGYDGFACAFRNNSDKIAKIVWEGSTIYYDGSSYLPFIEGQKYIDAKSKPMPATILPKDGYLLKMVYSSEQPYFGSTWVMMPIRAKLIQIIFQIDSESSTEYVTANISYHFDDE